MPSVAANVTGPTVPRHWPPLKLAPIVALSPSQISDGDTVRVPLGGMYPRTVTVVSAEASLYPSAVTFRPILYGPGSRPVAPNSSLCAWLTGSPLMVHWLTAPWGNGPFGARAAVLPWQIWLGLARIPKLKLCFGQSWSIGTVLPPAHGFVRGGAGGAGGRTGLGRSPPNVNRMPAAYRRLCWFRFCEG